MCHRDVLLLPAGGEAQGGGVPGPSIPPRPQEMGSLPTLGVPGAAHLLCSEMSE